MKINLVGLIPVLSGMTIALLFMISGCAAISGKPADASKSTAAFTGEFADGVYEGSAAGHSGIIAVRVCVEGGSIAEISVSDSREDPSTGGVAIDELLEMALVYNTADLDAISGATESSEGFLTAVRNALKQAAHSP